MNNKSMTAMMCLFAMANHQKNSYCVVNDSVSERLITDDEYNGIYESMSQGGDFFKTNSTEERINKFIAPTVIARNAFNRQSLAVAMRLGVERYMVLGAGYDTTAYSLDFDNIEVIEIDRDFKDKISRLDRAGINHKYVRYIESELPNLNFSGDKKVTYCSMLGVSYYLGKKDLENTFLNLASISAEGSSLVFDYPTICYDDKIRELAFSAGEPMTEKYPYSEMQRLLSKCGYRIYELVHWNEVDERYFKLFNTLYKSSPLKAQNGVNLCLAVKK